MSLDAAACYAAMESRDRRFEGRFIIGVQTTGIYCRPGCPARLPRRENVRFYATTAAAEEAGLRACLRCRPDASPGSPAAQGTPATVRRALRLIREGALDGDGVQSLALRLGLGDRQLRRLFDRHLGASPLQVARTQRAHFARKLLEETRLPLAELAGLAGFSSVRRFNDAVRQTFHKTPTELRKRARPPSPEDEDPSGLTLRLPFRPPLAWDHLLSFLASHAIPGVERIEGGAYARTIALGAGSGLLEARLHDARGVVSLRIEGAAGAELYPLVERARALFDLDADPLSIAEHLGRDPVLARAFTAQPGLRVPGAWSGFELAVRVVLGQQISVRAANTIAGRLVEQFGAPTGRAGALGRLFPTPEALAGADLSGIGLVRARAETVRALAAAAAAGALDLSAPTDLDSAIERLCAIAGVGPWTAHSIAMRALREPDAMPSSDLALRRPLGLCTPRALEERSSAWRPFRAYAAMALWWLDAAASRKDP